MWSNIIEDDVTRKSLRVFKIKRSTKKFLEEYNKNAEKKFKAFKGATNRLA